MFYLFQLVRVVQHFFYILLNFTALIYLALFPALINTFIFYKKMISREKKSKFQMKLKQFEQQNK